MMQITIATEDIETLKITLESALEWEYTEKELKFIYRLIDELTVHDVGGT